MTAHAELAGKQWVARLPDMTDEQTLMAGRQSVYGIWDARCDALYNEAERRGKTDLYTRGFNAARREAGRRR